MVLPSNAVPPNESWIARGIAAQRREMREGLASVAASFRSTVAELAEQVAFLAGQSEYDSRSSGHILPPSTPGAGVVPFDATVDAHVAIRTSSTGRIVVTYGGYLALWSDVITTAGLAAQILHDGGEVAMLDAAGLGLDQTGLGESSIQASVARQEVVALSPDTEYAVRIRRRYDLDYGPAQIHYGSTWLSATKLGM